MSTNFPTSLDSYTTKVHGDTIAESHINDIQDAVVAVQTKVGTNSSSNSDSHDYKISQLGDFFASGRKLYLYENAAPTGWAIVSVTDRILAVKGGSQAYNVSGGTTGGTWTQPTHTHTGPSHRHSMQSHVHSMQSHTHSMQGHTHTLTSAVGNTGIMFGGTALDPATWSPTTAGPSSANTGAPSSSNTAAPNTSHTGYDGTQTTSSSTPPNTWRPPACVGIIIVKS